MFVGGVFSGFAEGVLVGGAFGYFGGAVEERLLDLLEEFSPEEYLLPAGFS